jgi:hypothetical protein
VTEYTPKQKAFFYVKELQNMGVVTEAKLPPAPTKRQSHADKESAGEEKPKA